MTITLDLAPATEALLSDLADREGQDRRMVAASLLAAALERAAHEREVEAVLEGLADSHAGRVTPLAEWDAKFRAQHNIRAGAEPMSDEEAQSLLRVRRVP